MLTRCPACQTVFRLGAGQLARRGGEVRCGHCYQAFNALDHEIQPPQAARERVEESSPRPQQAPPSFFLLEESAPAASPTVDDADLMPTPHAQAAAEEGSAPDAEAAAGAQTIVDEKADDTEKTADDEAILPTADLLSSATAEDEEASRSSATAAALPEVMRSRRHAASAQPGAETASKASFAYDAERALGMDGLARSSQFSAADLAPPPDASPEAETSAASAARLDCSTTETASDDAAPELTADRTGLEQLDARYGRPPAQGSKAARVLMNLLLAALGLVLAGQLLYLARHELARQLPALRPLLETGCSYFGCEVLWPRQARLLSLEASDLHSVPGQPERYQLDLTLSNRAEYAQAWPHLELTLTDTRDQTLVRRVLNPQEWMPADEDEPSFAAYRSISTRIPFVAPELGPTGYRVYVFYP